MFKSEATDEQREDLEDKLFRGVADYADIEQVTDRLGDEIGRVYGWQFSQREAGIRSAER